MITVQQSDGRGRGVFACRPFVPGELIERAPVIVVPAADLDYLNRTALAAYCYKWGPDGDEAAIALGCGSLYNHSYRPNAHFETLFDEKLIKFIAIRPIAAGEEITVNYNGSPEDQTPLWFADGDWGWR